MTPAGSTASTPACRARSASSPTARTAKTLATVETLARLFARAGLSPGRRRRRRRGRHRHRRRRVRRRHLPPGHGLRERGHHAAGAGRRRHRRQDRGQPARGQEPRRRLLATQRRAVRHRDPGHTAAPRVGLRPGRDRQVRLPGRRPDGGPADRGAGGPLRRHQGGRGGRGRARGRPAHDPQLRPHAGARPRGRRPWPITTMGPAPRRGGGHRHALRRPAGGRLGRIDEDRVAEHRRVLASFDLPTDLPRRRRGGGAGGVHGPGQEGAAGPHLRARRPEWGRARARRGRVRRGRYPGGHGCP